MTYGFFLEGNMSWAADRLIAGLMFSGPSIFSRWRSWRPAGTYAPSEMFTLQGEDTQAPALGITTHSFAVPRRTSPALQGWHERQFAPGLTVAEGATNPCWQIWPWRRPVGHCIWTFVWSQFLREFRKTTARLLITLWCLTRSDTWGCPSTEHGTFGHKKWHSAEEDGNS